MASRTTNFGFDLELVSPTGEDFCVGSSRVSAEHIAVLKDMFQIVTVSSAPKNWLVYSPE